MLDLVKSYEFFKPEKCRDTIHIIGCGSVGATIAENLSRFGLTKIVLYDFDVVESRNIANQIFLQKHIGVPKTQALLEMLCEINPELRETVKIESEGYTGQPLSGYIFLAVDNIDLRREIVAANKDNVFIKAVFDVRTGLTSAQHYAAAWNDSKMVQDLLNSMAFTHEEAVAETPMSACGATLSVCPTVRCICALAVANFTNYVNGCKLKKFMVLDAFSFTLDAF
ncbi:MAG: ThiF family adenylyltransferase [Bacteroides sp.]